jgi:4-hydroxy-2-oxoglutarate aldolase
MIALRGVFGPVVTTFHRGSENPDLDAFRANVRAHMAAGLAGVLVCGSTGEAALLGEDERLALLDAARAEVPRGRLALMGVGAESTRLTIQRAVDAKRAGADAVLVVAPHYYSNAMTPAALRVHYQRVADASPLPVVLYNIPKYMHFKLAPDLVAELAQHANIVGIKDSSGDLELLGGYLQSASDTFTVITGNGGQLATALERGAKGGILGLSLFAGRECVAIFDAHTRGEHAGAHALQEPLKTVNATVVGELGPPGVKAALDAVGLCGGPVRGPLRDLDAAGVARVREVLASGGVFPQVAMQVPA